MLLKNGKGSGYKELAKKAERSQKFEIGKDNYELNLTGGQVVVDVRSCLFKYLRTVCTARSIWKKIHCIFRIILKGIEAEMMHTFKEAFMAIRADATRLSMKTGGGLLYVFCDERRCPYRERQKIASRIADKTAASERLTAYMNTYKRDLLNVDAIVDMHTAFEGYLITHVEEVCLAFNGIEHALGVPYTKPEQEDNFESDRLCARLAKNSSIILSEDYDCIALFGADRMVLSDSSENEDKIRYVDMSNVMDAFGSSNREELLYKCLLMGTDYNLGVKGIGPARIQRLDTYAAKQEAEECMLLQSLDIDDVKRFFMIV